jgi:hypothetical protein
MTPQMSQGKAAIKTPPDIPRSKNPRLALETHKPSEVYDPSERDRQSK